MNFSNHIVNAITFQDNYVSLMEAWFQGSKIREKEVDAY